MFSHALIFLLSFVGIWVGSGLAIKSVERLARTLHVSSFLISFLVLGFFTSISELSVGVNAVLNNDPEIFVGNLIGASIVLMLLIIPLLAITGNSIKISPEFRGFNLPASLLVVALPVVLVMDGQVGPIDSLIAVGLYGLLLISLQTRRGLLEKLRSISARSTVQVGKELLKICFGLAVIFVASRFLVQQTVYFSELLQVSPFIVSLLVIALGTNIPEMSIVVRSIFMKSNQIAFGDYIGSAAFNTFLLGVLTLVNGQPVMLANSYLVSLSALVIGLLVLYYFSRTNNTISRWEGLALLGLYGLFIASEVVFNTPAL